MSGPESSAPAKSGGKITLWKLFIWSLWLASFYAPYRLLVVRPDVGTLCGIGNLSQGVVYEVLRQTKDPMGGDVGYLVQARTLPASDNKDARPSEPRWYDLPTNPPAAHFIVVELYGKPHLMKSPEGQ